MIAKFLLSFVAGFVAHQTKQIIDRHIFGTWNYFFRVTLGDLAKLPCTIFLYLDLSDKNMPQERPNNRAWIIAERLTIAYLMSSGTFFIGVIFGYFLDAVRGVLKE